MNETLDRASQYIGRTWRVLPLHSIGPDGFCTCQLGTACKSPGKHPRGRTGKNHLTGSTLDMAVVERWQRRWPGMNLGIVTGFEASRLAVVDVDGAQGRATLERLQVELGPLPATAAVTSGRVGGGLHLYYRVTRPAPENDGDGLDIRGDGGLVVAPPSRHASGSVYKPVEPQRNIVDLPDAWLDWFANRSKKGEQKELPVLGLGPRPAHLRNDRHLARAAWRLEAVSIEDLRAVLLAIPNPNVGWKAWNNMAMAAWDACAGSEEGRLAFDECYSAKSPKYDPAESLERWQHYPRSPPTSIGFGALVFMAREAVPGFVLPSAQPRAAPLEEVNGTYALPAALLEPLGTQHEKPLIKLNERYAVIGDIGGKCLVLGFVPSKVDEVIRVPSFQSFKSFSERYANQYVVIKSVNKKGETVEEVKQVGPHWLKWTGRRSYEGIDLVPGAPAILPGNYLNLWSGFAVLPAPGSWELMKWHICHILAGGDAASAQYILRFAAWAVQHPGQRAEVALVFRGGKGSGKGTFANALARIFGQHGLQIYSPKHLVGSFNGHLRNCILLFADEAFWAGDKQGESVLKGMLTESTLVIEQKGVDATPWKNRLHVIMAANAEWVVPASHDERRYGVFDVSGERINDRAYFEALHAELSAGGLAAMLHDLQQVDLSGWHPRQIVYTEALRQQKERSLNALGAWWEGLLQGGVLPFHLSDKPRLAKASGIIGHARDFASRPGDVNPTSVGRFLRGQDCSLFHSRDGNYWLFPHLKDARGAWELKMHGWKWDVEIAEWGNTHLKPGETIHPFTNPSHISH